MMGAIIAAAVWLLTPLASAQATGEESPPDEAGPPAGAETEPDYSTDTTAPTDTKQPTLMDDPVEEIEEEEEIFGWFTVAPEVGYIYFPKATYSYRGFELAVEQRNGLIAKVHFDLGGDGLAFDIAPLFAAEFGGIDSTAGSFGNVSNLSNLADASFQAIGGQIALVYRFDVGHFFPHLGISFHGAYLMGNQIDYGVELYGRIPVGFTIYMGKHVGLVFEAAFMYGATGIKTPIKLPEDDDLFDSLPDSVRDTLEEAANNPEDIGRFAEDQEEYEAVREDFERWWIDHYEDFPEYCHVENPGEIPPCDSSKARHDIAIEYASDMLAESIRWGSGWGIDIVIGLRFP